MAKLDGTKVVVIGGASGVGFAVAAAALEAGAEVVVGSSQVPRIEAAAEKLGLGAKGRAVDVKDEASVAAFFDAAGPFDHLVFTAGDWGHMFGPTRDLDVELSWDASLETLAPDLAASMRPEYRPVTLRQLLSHRSGLPHDLKDEKALDALFYAQSPAGPSDRRRAYIARALQEAPAGPPGRFSYSNTGYLVAAAVAERATGSTYEALMRKEVFEPLAMPSANFGLPPAGQPGGHIRGRLAVPRDENPDFFAPAGNIYLSLDDWARFCIDQLKGAKGEGELLKPETFALMQTPQPGAPVSMGWFVESKFGDVPGPILHHEGSDGAWYAVAALFPKTGAGVLVAANAGKDMGGMALDMAAAVAAAKIVAP